MKLRLAPAGAAFVAALALVCGPGWSQNSRGDAWTAKYFPAAFEECFPIKLVEGDLIAVRVHRSNLNDLREYSIVFEDAQKSKTLRAVVREAQGSSLYRQLAALHAAQPSAPYDRLKRAIKVDVWTLLPNRCPAVTAQFKAFENVQFVRPSDDDRPQPNPVLYEFNETFAGGGSVLEFMENRPLPRWARATHHALDACIASGNATAGGAP
jgi:hypothetical protein